jgi:hypothetical protein
MRGDGCKSVLVQETCDDLVIGRKSALKARAVHCYGFEAERQATYQGHYLKVAGSTSRIGICALDHKFVSQRGGFHVHVVFVPQSVVTGCQALLQPVVGVLGILCKKSTFESHGSKRR